MIFYLTLKCKFKTKLVTGNLNINSITNKFYQQPKKVSQTSSTETKLDSNFLNQQFYIEHYCLSYRLDRNKHG